MIDELAPRQRVLLEAFAKFRERYGFAPTIRELGELVGISSTNGIKDHLKALRRKGCVEWEERRARTLRLTERGRLWLRHATEGA